MTHEPTLTTEGGGYVATCACGWLAWHVSRAVVEDMHRKHVPKREED